jgi:BCD family chlorophyll transporter-like MFS transporter
MGAAVDYRSTQFLEGSGMLRLALVQTAIGAVVVLATSTLNRIMIIELALPAALPAALVALHYAVQLLRPRVGYGADRGGRCTPWIIGGMALLAIGGFVAALATALMTTHRALGLALATLAYIAIGAGVGTAGTSNLVLLTKRVDPSRRATAATVMWVMMILGFGLSAGLVGHFLQPYSPERLVRVYAVAGTAAFLLALLAVWNVESRHRSPVAGGPPAGRPAAGGPGSGDSRAMGSAAAGSAGFGAALRALLAERNARCFTLFLFLSMLAFSAQELLIESFAGLVFHYAPGNSAQLAGLEHGGVLTGMIAVALISARLRARSFRGWMIAGTVGSAAAIGALALIGLLQAAAALPPVVYLLGVANGTFAVAALGAMMELSSAGGPGREGLRMGVWGAAQAVAFAIGGLTAGAALDVARYLWHRSGIAYAIVFAAGALLFLLAAASARRLQQSTRPAANHDRSNTEAVATGLATPEPAP